MPNQMLQSCVGHGGHGEAQLLEFLQADEVPQARVGHLRAEKA